MTEISCSHLLCIYCKRTSDILVVNFRVLSYILWQRKSCFSNQFYKSVNLGFLFGDPVPLCVIERAQCVFFNLRCCMKPPVFQEWYLGKLYVLCPNTCRVYLNKARLQSLLKNMKGVSNMEEILCKTMMVFLPLHAKLGQIVDGQCWRNLSFCSSFGTSLLHGRKP